MAIKVKLTIDHVVVFDTPCKVEYLLKNSAIPFHVCERKFIMVKKTHTPFWTTYAFENQRLRIHLSRHFLSHPSSTHTAWLSHYLFFFFHFIMILLELRKYLLLPLFEFLYSFLIIALQLVPIINLSSISLFRFFFGVFFSFWKNYKSSNLIKIYWLISL